MYGLLQFAKRAEEIRKMELKQHGDQVEMSFLSELNNNLFGEGEETIIDSEGNKSKIPYALMERKGYTARQNIQTYRERVNESASPANSSKNWGSILK